MRPLFSGYGAEQQARTSSPWARSRCRPGRCPVPRHLFDFWRRALPSRSSLGVLEFAGSGWIPSARAGLEDLTKAPVDPPFRPADNPSAAFWSRVADPVPPTALMPPAGMGHVREEAPDRQQQNQTSTYPNSAAPPFRLRGARFWRFGKQGRVWPFSQMHHLRMAPSRMPPRVS